MTELTLPDLGWAMANLKLESDSLDDHMEDVPRVPAPAGTSGGCSPAHRVDRTLSSADFGSAAGSPPEAGPVTPRDAPGMSFYTFLSLYETF